MGSLIRSAIIYYLEPTSSQVTVYMHTCSPLFNSNFLDFNLSLSLSLSSDGRLV